MRAPEQPSRGLQAVRDDRERRDRFPQMPPRFWLWVFTVLAVWAIIYWKINQGELESARNRILAEQRAVSSELSPRFVPLRDKLEHWITTAAGPYPGDIVDPDAKTSKFRSKPGVYVRLFIDDAREIKSIRRSAAYSLRDAFTSCLMRGKNPDPFAGPACKFSRECASGEHCNENFHCSTPAQPYNLRVAYRAMRVLDDEWGKEVRNAGDDMRLRLLQRELQSAISDDIPLAIELMAQAQSLVLILDEQAASPVSEPDAGTLSEALQAVSHPTRVFVFDIPQNSLLLRLRTEVTAEVGTAGVDPLAVVSVRRQANNCALAVEVRKALGDEGVQ